MSRSTIVGGLMMVCVLSDGCFVCWYDMWHKYMGFGLGQCRVWYGHLGPGIWGCPGGGRAIGLVFHQFCSVNKRKIIDEVKSL